MKRMSRRSGIVAVLALSVCLGMAGCLSTGSEQPVVRQSGGALSTQKTMYPPPSPGGVRQTGYAQPMPGKIEEIHMEPDGPGAPMVMPHPGMAPMNLPLPGELKMVSHPPHRVAPPDILYLEALQMVPKGPYRLRPMEVLQIEATDSLPGQPIKGLFMISPEGKISLGYSYSSIQVGGMTVEAAQEAIRVYLSKIVTGFKNNTAALTVTLVQMRGLQNIKGEHLVRPDGTIHLGMYGSVYVAGMTLGQVKCVVENHLAAYLVDPQISVDVRAYNSRKIYLIFEDGGGTGEYVIPIPATGNETVLDVIGKQGYGPQQLPYWSTRKIWVARPSPAGHPCSTVLPVDWKAITQAGRTETNYQLLPGDRIFVKSDPWLRFDYNVGKVLSPFERVLNFTLLGNATVQSLRGNNSGVLIAP